MGPVELIVDYRRNPSLGPKSSNADRTQESLTYMLLKWLLLQTFQCLKLAGSIEKHPTNEQVENHDCDARQQ